MRPIVLGLFASAALSTAVRAEPIMLAPGQCIMIGNKEVCAVAQSGTAGQHKPLKTMHVCRFGKHADGEVGDLKTYQLVEIIVQPNGSKTETALKNFGNVDKDGCEKEAARLTAEAKADAKEAK